MYNQRLYEIIYILLSQKKVTCEELATYFEVSRHTIMRDMETLTAAGVPICMEKGRKGGVHLFQEATRNPADISSEEQQAILASLQGLSMLSGKKGNALLEKLKVLLDRAPSALGEMDFDNWRQAAAEDDKFGRIQEGILNRRLIGFDYTDTYGRERACQVEPMLLWLEQGEWYLRGYCLDEAGYRLYKLLRMAHVEVKAEGFVRRQLLLDESEKAEGEGMVGLKLKIAGKRRERVYEEFEEGQIAMDGSGDFEVSVEYPEGEWLYDFLLSFGSDLQVLYPDDVREKLRNMVQQITEFYQ